MLNPPFRRTQPLPTRARLEELLAQAERSVEQKTAESVKLAQQALHMAQQLGLEAAWQRACLLLGRAHYQNGNSRQALTCLTSLEQARLGPRLSAEWHLIMGRCYNDLGETPLATTHLTKAVEQAQAIGHSDLTTAALNALAGVYYTQGNYVEALTALNQAVQLARVLGQTHQEAKFLNNIGQIFTRMGNYAAALENLLQAYSLIRTIPDNAQNEATYLLSIGALHQQMNNLELAYDCFAKALEWGRSAHNPRVECVALNNLANVLLLQESWERAKEYFEAALALARDLGNKHFEIDNLDGLGQVFRTQGAFEKAILYHQQVLQMAQALEDREGVVEALLNLGRDYLAANWAEEALTALSKALEQAQQQGYLKAVYEAHQLIARAYRYKGQFEQALEHHEAFFRVREQVLEQEKQQQGQMLTAQFALERARHERALMQQLTQQAQSRTAEQIERLEEVQLELLNILATLTEYRHDPNNEHVFRVAEYAAQIATALGWPSERVEELRRASLLHDLGKVGLAEELLEKCGPLTEAERLQMRHHTEIGHELLAPNRSSLLKLAASIAYSHHEHWDGSGYPQGLKGEAIPLEARIVAIADCYDVMTRGRAYQPPLTPLEAAAELKRQKGRQFDPELVEVALKVFR
ncbi:tetratricopeptide repeat protein [Meiothermus rufus]|uniref:tetratricopeptide repeat protein n=1 Tax=Meiothermus rufus TaxID=604332 RepID=UPI0006851F3F|nr:tetratricopeptide repeat protein [Meiothermus rufus]